MKINYLIILFLLLTLGIIAQNSNIQTDLEFLSKNQPPEIPVDPNEKQTLYEIGEPITSFESNFKNLFRNVPEYVESGEIKLKNYELFATLSSKRDLKKYKKLLINATVPEMSGVRSEGTATNSRAKRKSVVHFTGYTTISDALKKPFSGNDSINRIYKKMFKREMKVFMQNIDRAFQIGNVMYKINYTHGVMDDVMYVVCDPKTKRVIIDNFFYGLKVQPNLANPGNSQAFQ